MMAACPTTVIPFFGDQTFWGSAVYRRGVGPRPIPIDSLTTKKLVQALEFMQRPEVKREAEKVSALIQMVSHFPSVSRVCQAFLRRVLGVEYRFNSALWQRSSPPLISSSQWNHLRESL